MLWIDGALHTGTVAEFDLRDRGLLLGDGLFETIAVFGHVPFRLDNHLARLMEAGHALALPIDLDAARVAIAALVSAWTPPHGVIRLTVTRGVGDRGLAPPAAPRPTLFATMAPWTAPDPAPVALVRAAIRRNESSPTSRLKTLCYLDPVLALQAALDAGADDAVMLNTRGQVACASAANLFCLRGTVLATPPVADGVLPGIMRALVLDGAAGLGLDGCERSLAWQDLRDADAVFLTNSVRLVRAVAEIDGHALPAAGVHLAARVRAMLGAAIRRECGVDPLAGEGQGAALDPLGPAAPDPVFRE